MLLLVAVSPGTFSIVAVSVAEPAGGELVSVTEQLLELPAVISGTTFWPLALPTVTLQTTLRSVLAPLLVKFSVNVGAGLPGTVLPLALQLRAVEAHRFELGAVRKRPGRARA